MALLLPFPACGERVGVRGRFRQAQNCGSAPSPGSSRFARPSDLSPHGGRGERQVARISPSLNPVCVALPSVGTSPQARGEGSRRRALFRSARQHACASCSMLPLVVAREYLLGGARGGGREQGAKPRADVAGHRAAGRLGRRVAARRVCRSGAASRMGDGRSRRRPALAVVCGRFRCRHRPLFHGGA